MTKPHLPYDFFESMEFAVGFYVLSFKLWMWDLQDSHTPANDWTDVQSTITPHKSKQTFNMISGSFN